MTYPLLILGIAALLVGAEILVSGAGSIAVRTGLSPVVVGLTVVAFGTSAPELAVSVQSSLQGRPGLAVGNVVGSNITNVLLVLGLAALVGGGIAVAQKLVRIDVPLMILATVVVILMSIGGVIGRIEGAILFAGIVAYVAWTVRAARKETDEVQEQYAEGLHDDIQLTSWPREIAQVIAGIALLVLGSTWLVNSSSDIASSLGVSDLIIGLTVVAFGTSAPELATSVVAARKGEGDLAVGNVVGSNMFNLLCVLGATALVSPNGLPVSQDALRLDMPIMLAVSIACLPVFFDGFKIRRWEGAIFFAFYVAYLTFLVLDATGSGLRDSFAVVMSVFVLPITVLTLVAVGVRAWNRRKLSI